MQEGDGGYEMGPDGAGGWMRMQEGQDSAAIFVKYSYNKNFVHIFQKISKFVFKFDANSNLRD